MDEVYCALCGVCFDVYTELYGDRLREEDADWTSYYQALRPPSADEPGSSWRFSGIGQISGCFGWRGHLPPSGHDERIVRQDELASDQDPHQYQPAAELPGSIAAYKGQGDSTETVYPIHPACWDIFLRQHAILATQNPLAPNLELLGEVFQSLELEGGGSGLKPDWTTDYAGAEQFYDDGWAWSEDTEASNVRILLEDTEEWDFIVYDPERIKSGDEILQGLPTLARNSIPQQISLRRDTKEVFLRLPPELLPQILCFLPTLSVRSLRLASRVMANVPLNSMYWKSRFAFPNELSGVQFPTELLKQQTGDMRVDWERLCNQLLHPNESYPSWENRKRISSLTAKLAQSLLLKSVPNTETRDETKGELTDEGLICRQYFTSSSRKISKYQSVTFGREFFQDALKNLSVNSQSRQGKKLVIGLAFKGSTELSAIGKYDDRYAEHFTFRDGEYLQSLEVGLIPDGIVHLTVIAANSNRTSSPPRRFTFGCYDGRIAYGRLLPKGNSRFAGISAGIANNGTIVSIGLLEPRTATETDEAQPLVSGPQGNLWFPSLPSVTLQATTAVGQSHDTGFSYMQQIQFATVLDDLRHLVLVTAFIALNPTGIHGFQFCFDDRPPIPAERPTNGREVSFLIDGPGGERIEAIDVLWSQEVDHRCTGIVCLTNRDRQGTFVTAHGSDGICIQKIKALPNSFVAGIFGKVAYNERRQEAYQKLGLLCSPCKDRVDTSSAQSTSKTPRLDDHMNVWTGETVPSPNTVLGEAICYQPTNGFINWIDFRKPIKRVTACEQYSRSDGPRWSASGHPMSPKITIGLRFESRDNLTMLLGRYQTFGHSVELLDDERLLSIEVGMEEKAKLVVSIRLTGDKGFQFSTEDSQEFRRSGEVPGIISKIELTGQSSNLELVGMTWSFDLADGSGRKFAIQPVYSHRADPAYLGTLQKTLYPSVRWLRPPPSALLLRPVPPKESRPYWLEPSLLDTDNVESFSDLDLVSIQVYFNAFLQGVVLHYKNGQTRVIGNTIGTKGTIRIEGERIFAVWFHERMQGLIRTWPLSDVLCVDGIQFGLVKWVDSQPLVRFSPFFGPTQLFGPFIHQQIGLWNANFGDSADWASCFFPQTRPIFLEPGTSFGGLYCESFKTHIRRAGVLVSRHNPLPDQAASLPRPIKPPTDETESLPKTSPGFVPWLGPPPQNSFITLPAAGLPKGTYRMWCPTPPSTFQVSIYRHSISNRLVVIGVEFHHARGIELSSTLLGHRTLNTEHTNSTSLEQGEQILGFSTKTNHEEEAWGLEMAAIITTSQDSASYTEDTRIGRTSLPDPAEIAGYYIYVDEFIQAIGLLQKQS